MKLFWKIIHAKNFWPSVYLFTGIFIILFNLIRIMIEFEFNFVGYFEYYLLGGHWISFVIANLAGGLFYGFIMTYYRYWRYLRKKE